MQALTDRHHHNTQEQNEAFRAAWDATNERWKAQQRAHEAEQATKQTKPEAQNGKFS